LRYETDLTDAEWVVIKPLMPEPRQRGRPRAWPLREIVNAIFYVLRGGIAWRLIPKDLPPRTTVYRWFAQWRDTGLFERINHLLVMADRERVGRDPSPTAAVIDSQSVKTTESGGEAAGHGRHGWTGPHPGAPACRWAGPRWSAHRPAPVAPLVPLHRQGFR
jgi:transposase